MSPTPRVSSPRWLSGAAFPFIVAILLAAAPSWAADEPASTAPRLKVIVQQASSDEGRAACASVEAHHGVLVAERGSYAVYSVESSSRAALESLPGVVVRDDFDIIHLRREQIDTRLPAASARSMGDRPLRLVQFAAPPDDADLARLRHVGAEVVHYVPQNAYIVWVGTEEASARLADMATASTAIQHASAYLPEHALSADLDGELARAELVEVAVQFYNFGKEENGRTVVQDVDAAIAIAQAITANPEPAVFGRYLNVRFLVRGSDLAALAAIDSVVNVEPYQEPVLFGERQGQMMAGNLNPARTGPSGPGYLQWLSGHGFPTIPATYPVVVVVDDGVDNGNALSPANPEFLGGDGGSRIAFSVIPPGSSAGNSSGPDGHGTINASIVGGFNNDTGSGVEDGAGFNYGLGISPYGQLANVRIFHPGFDVGTSHRVMVRDYYQRGARISTNSWGEPFSRGKYDIESQLYDEFTRDANDVVAGNQQMLFLFSAGNDGSSINTVSSPSTAKNVISVAAGETSNPAAQGGDGCGTPSFWGDNVQDMAGFSSRGPCDDLRAKPDITAPGTFIMGAAPRPLSNFNGSGVCGAPGNNGQLPGTDALFPPGTNYTWSSGTSHSCPGAAGFAQLLVQIYPRIPGAGSLAGGARAPWTPALIKAFALTGTRHMTGVGANENLPGEHQGFGAVDMETAFKMAAPRFFVSQETTLGSSGQAIAYTGTVANSSEPIRVGLAWTDAPGATSGFNYINDLNLVVRVGGQTYRGNNFNKGVSQAGGVPDFRNNAECVFLPAGFSGEISVTVEAMTIAADGVPGNEDTTDQDFGLVVYNFSSDLRSHFTRGATVSVTDEGGNGNGNGFMEPGETQLGLTIDLTNIGGADSPGATAVLSARSKSATILQSTASYPAMAVGQSAASLTPFQISLNGAHECGERLLLTMTVTSASGGNTFDFTVPTGSAGEVTNFEISATPNAEIPDNSQHSEFLQFEQDAVIENVDVFVDINHTWVSDLRVSAVSPSGTEVILFDHHGGAGQHIRQVTFDDEAAFPIATGTPPYGPGSFQPFQPLAAMIGEPAAGVWRVTATDNHTGNPGVLRAVRIHITAAATLCATLPLSLVLDSTTVSDAGVGGNGNGAADPGESFLLTLPVRNDGDTDSGNLVGVLTSVTPGVTVGASTSPYSIGAGQTVPNSAAYMVTLAPSLPCGSVADLRLGFSTPQGTFQLPVELTVGRELGGTIETASMQVPLPLMDSPFFEFPAFTVSSLEFSGVGTIVDVDVTGLNIAHTWDEDLIIQLRSPQGTIIDLSARNGSSNNDYLQTTFDDSASLPISLGEAPFSGSFKPAVPLAGLNGQNPNGTWLLIVSDWIGGDTGTLHSWSIRVTTTQFECSPVEAQPIETTGVAIR